MLVSALQTANQNDYLSLRMQAAFDFLRDADLANLPLGRIDIDGNNVFANVQEYTTVPASQKHMEAHRRFYDVQYVVEGAELMQYAPLAGLDPIGEFDEETDIGAYATPAEPSTIVLSSGALAVLAPEDAHKPGCAFIAPSPVRKVVVKVLV